MALYNPTLSYPVNIGINGNFSHMFTAVPHKDPDEITEWTSMYMFLYDLDNVLIYTNLGGAINNFQVYVPSIVLSNGNFYKWRVDLYAGTELYSSKYSTFSTLADGVLTIDALPSPFNSQFYTFTATYTQAEGVLPKSSKWRLYDSLNVLILESPDILGIDISYEIEGFENGTTYKIECEVTNQRNVTKVSSRLTFTPTYDYPEDTPSITIESNNKIGSITVGWQNLVIQNGSVDGTSSYATGKFNLGLQLDPDSCLIYDFFRETTEKFTLNMWLKLATNFTGDIIKLYKDDELFYRVGYNNDLDRFFYERDYRITAGGIIAIPTEFFMLSVTNDRIYYEIDSVQYELF